MRKVGIWIDQKEANLITLTKNAIHSKTIYSDVETRIRTEGETKQFGRFGDQYLVDEKGIKNRIEEFTHRYLISILKELKKQVCCLQRSDRYQTIFWALLHQSENFP